MPLYIAVFLSKFFGRLLYVLTSHMPSGISNIVKPLEASLQFSQRAAVDNVEHRLLLSVADFLQNMSASIAKIQRCLLE